MENIYKQIQEAVVEKFGVNCSAELQVNIHPLNFESSPRIKVRVYDIQPDGSSKAVTETYIQSSGGVNQLPTAIRESNYEQVA